MANTIQGALIDGKIYKYDYNYLENTPEELPEFSAEQSNKILAVNSTGDAIEWVSKPPKELPNYNQGDAGKILSVNNNGNGVEWTNLPENELPTYTEDDEYKRLAVSRSGEGVEWVEPELPSYSENDSFKVLSVNESGDGIEWANIPKEIPSHTASTKNKLLSVNSQGNLVWDKIEEILTSVPNYNINLADATLVIDNCTSDGFSWKRLIPKENASAGKVLSVVDAQGNLGWSNIPKELPVIHTVDGGKALTVNNTRTGVEWSRINQVPPSSQQESGNVLTVDLFGYPVWAEPAEGLPTIDTHDNGKVLTVVDNYPVWDRIETLPVFGCDNNGDVLTVFFSGGDYVAGWKPGLPDRDNTNYHDVLIAGDTVPHWYSSPLVPNPTQASEGDVLTVNNQGGIAWAEPSANELKLYKYNGALYFDALHTNKFVDIYPIGTETHSGYSSASNAASTLYEELTKHAVITIFEEIGYINTSTKISHIHYIDDYNNSNVMLFLTYVGSDAIEKISLVSYSSSSYVGSALVGNAHAV